VFDSPSDKVPEKASRWDRGRTETCGGGKVISGGSLLVSQYLRIYRSGIRSDEATSCPQGIRARLPPRARLVALLSPRLPSGLLPKLPGSLMSRKKSSKSFVAFGLRLVLIFWKTKNRQKTATGTRHWVNRLVPNNDIK
jgi:hypothetical protein